jgi:hypothetical protein
MQNRTKTESSTDEQTFGKSFPEKKHERLFTDQIQNPEKARWLKTRIGYV